MRACQTLFSALVISSLDALKSTFASVTVQHISIHADAYLVICREKSLASEASRCMFEHTATRQAPPYARRDST